MAHYLQNLITNPLIITGILMALSVFIYFSLEYRHMTHKTKKERALIIIGWGVFFIIIALVALFTTSLNLIAKSANLLPKEVATDLYTLDKIQGVCTSMVNGAEPLTQAYLEGCDIIRYVYYSAYSLLGLGTLLLLLGVIKSLLPEKPKQGEDNNLPLKKDQVKKQEQTKNKEQTRK